MNGTERLVGSFDRVRIGDGAALLPYVTAGYPSTGATRELLPRISALGVCAIEVGFPFSDSIADGPVIQESFYDALAGGFRVGDAFEIVRDVRGDVDAALIAMVSCSLVHRFGTSRFIETAADAGFDGVIFPDVPAEEAEQASSLCRARGLAYVGLVAPSTSPDRAARIARISSGFVYRIAVAGTTGERAALPAGLAEDVALLRSASGLPVCVGFGVSTADQVRQVCAASDGAIVGSAIVRRLRTSVSEGLPEAAAIDDAVTFVAELANASRPAM